MRVTHNLASGGEWVQPSSSSHGSKTMRAMRVTHDLASGGEWAQPSSSSHSSKTMRATSPKRMLGCVPIDRSHPVEESPPSPAGIRYREEKKGGRTGGKPCQNK